MPRDSPYPTWGAETIWGGIDWGEPLGSLDVFLVWL